MYINHNIVHYYCYIHFTTQQKTIKQMTIMYEPKIPLTGYYQELVWLIDREKEKKKWRSFEWKLYNGEHWIYNSCQMGKLSVNNIWPPPPFNIKHPLIFIPMPQVCNPLTIGPHLMQYIVAEV